MTMKVELSYTTKNSIPLIECYQKELKVKGVLGKSPMVFFSHGFSQSKEDNYDMIIGLARLGFMVVAIDAVMHGERAIEPFLTGGYKERQQLLFDVVTRTAEDIAGLFDSCYSSDFESFASIGFSMGGSLGLYLPMITRRIQAVAAIQGAPSFGEFIRYKAKVQHWSFEVAEMLYNKYEKMEGLKHPESYRGLKLFLTAGLQDEIVPAKWTDEFVTLLNERGEALQLEYRTYDIGHRFAWRVKQELFEWCKRELLVS